MGGTSGMMRCIGIMAAVMLAPCAQAADACRRNEADFDVCQQAIKLKSAFGADVKGKRVGRGVYQDLDVDGPALSYVVTWPLPPVDVARYVDGSGQAPEPLRGQLVKVATDTVCNDPQSSAMTRLGATYTYRFALPDGRALDDVRIANCPQP